MMRSGKFFVESSGEISSCGIDFIKTYPELSHSTVEGYHGIHSSLSGKKNVIGYGEVVKFCIKEQELLSYFLKMSIDNITLEVLDLGNNIQDDENGVITRVPYIEGKTLDELYKGRFQYQLLCYMITNYLRNKYGVKLIDIIEASAYNNGLMSIMPKLTTGVLCYEEIVNCSSDIHPVNIKVISHENGHLHLTITDLGASIKRLVGNNLHLIEK